MGTIVGVAGVAVVGLFTVVALLWGRTRPSVTKNPDFGSVSDSWLAELKMGGRDRFS